MEYEIICLDIILIKLLNIALSDFVAVGAFMYKDTFFFLFSRVMPYIPFVVSRAFMAVASSQAGDADFSRAPGLTSGLQGSVNVHRGAVLLVPP